METIAKAEEMYRQAGFFFPRRLTLCVYITRGE